MTGPKTGMKSDGIPTYIDLDLSVIDVMGDVSNGDYEKYNGISIPFIKTEEGKPRLYWMTLSGRSLHESIWTGEQIEDAGITEDMMRTASNEAGKDRATVIPDEGSSIYPISDEIKERIDSWLMEVHERKMREMLAEIIMDLELEGNYNWTMEDWVLAEDVPDDIVRRDAIKMGINPDLQDDWDSLLLVMLDEKLNAMK